MKNLSQYFPHNYYSIPQFVPAHLSFDICQLSMPYPTIAPCKFMMFNNLFLHICPVPHTFCLQLFFSPLNLPQICASTCIYRDILLSRNRRPLHVNIANGPEFIVHVQDKQCIYGEILISLRRDYNMSTVS